MTLNGRSETPFTDTHKHKHTHTITHCKINVINEQQYCVIPFARMHNATINYLPVQFTGIPPSIASFTYQTNKLKEGIFKNLQDLPQPSLPSHRWQQKPSLQALPFSFLFPFSSALLACRFRAYFWLL